VGRRLRRYRRLERLSLETNRELQWQALGKLLQHAYNSSPFYRRRFDDAGLLPSRIIAPSDLKRIQLLTRADIRNHLPEIRSSVYRADELASAATGGTTDTPVPLLRDRESLREKTAIHWQFNLWAGLRPGDRVFHLWGARQDFNPNPSWRWKLYDRYLMRQVWAPTSLFNEEVLESYRQTLNRFRPRIISAYPTPLALFCEFLRDCGRPYQRPVGAICTAEPLLDRQRKIIEETLGCPTFERYATRDFGTVAAECERHCGLHWNPAAAYVEYLPVEGAEVEGLHEILVTDLLSYGMPLIRYRINDCALLGAEQCTCGRGYPLVRRITGRTTDVFYLPNGDVVPGVALTNRVLQVCPGLKKTQVVQDTMQDFRVRYVPGPGFDPSQLELLRTNLRKFFPEQVSIIFEQVADIERERSGKTRFCISRVVDPTAHCVQAIPGRSE
jgi:phenylacetate-CoA ligase